MSEPEWFKSRVRSWTAPKKPRRVVRVKMDPKRCDLCKTVLSSTPDGLVCFYCEMSTSTMEIDL